MTADDAQVRKQVVDSIIKAVAKKTAVIVGLAAVASLAIGPGLAAGLPLWFLPFSVLFGGALGLVNFRWLAISVQRFYLKPGATPTGSNFAAVLISMLKLSLIFIILFAVIKWQMVHVFGLVAGLSLCFLAILWEGFSMMQNLQKGNTE